MSVAIPASPPHLRAAPPACAGFPQRGRPRGMTRGPPFSAATSGSEARDARARRRVQRASSRPSSVGRALLRAAAEPTSRCSRHEWRCWGRRHAAVRERRAPRGLARDERGLSPTSLYHPPPVSRVVATLEHRSMDAVSSVGATTLYSQRLEPFEPAPVICDARSGSTDGETEPSSHCNRLRMMRTPGGSASMSVLRRARLSGSSSQSESSITSHSPREWVTVVARDGEIPRLVVCVITRRRDLRSPLGLPGCCP